MPNHNTKSDLRNSGCGKGDKPRPIDKDKYAENFDNINWGKGKENNDAKQKSN